jgi:hypothetical protein
MRLDSSPAQPVGTPRSVGLSGHVLDFGCGDFLFRGIGRPHQAEALPRLVGDQHGTGQRRQPRQDRSSRGAECRSCPACRSGSERCIPTRNPVEQGRAFALQFQLRRPPRKLPSIGRSGLCLFQHGEPSKRQSPERERHLCRLSRCRSFRRRPFRSEPGGRASGPCRSANHKSSWRALAAHRVHTVGKFIRGEEPAAGLRRMGARPWSGGRRFRRPVDSARFTSEMIRTEPGPWRPSRAFSGTCR